MEDEKCAGLGYVYLYSTISSETQKHEYNMYAHYINFASTMYSKCESLTWCVHKSCSKTTNILSACAH